MVPGSLNTPTRRKIGKGYGCFCPSVEAQGLDSMIIGKGQFRWRREVSLSGGVNWLMSLEVRTSSDSERQRWSVAFSFPKGIGTTESALHR